MFSNGVMLGDPGAGGGVVNTVHFSLRILNRKYELATNYKSLENI